MEQALEIIVPSHRRAGLVSTHRLVDKALICIPQAQFEEYLPYHDLDSIVCHPDDVIGLQAKRQWIYEKFGEMIMLDDDALQFSRIYCDPYPKCASQASTRRTKPTPARTWEILQQTGQVCRAMGAFMFGWNSHCNPATYSGCRPFRLGGFILGGAMGVLKESKVFWPRDTTLPICDFWASAINAYFHRMAFVDMRFGWGFLDTMHNPGGVAQYRHSTAEKEATVYLQKAFGKDVIHSKGSSGLRKAGDLPEMRQMSLPYRF